MSSSMKATVHLGSDHLQHLEVYKNTNFEEIQSLFNITQKLTKEHSEEILNVRTIERTSPSWTRSVLSHDQLIQWTKAKVCVYSDSALCLGKMWAQKDAIEKVKWKNSKCPLLMGNCWKSMDKQLNPSGIFSLDLLHCRFFRKSRMTCKNGTLNLKNSKIGSSSCQCSTILIGQRKGNDEICISNSEKVKTYAKKFSQGHWAFLGRGDEKKWCGKAKCFPEGR